MSRLPVVIASKGPVRFLKTLGPFSSSSFYSCFASLSRCLREEGREKGGGGGGRRGSPRVISYETCVSLHNVGRGGEKGVRFDRVQIANYLIRPSDPVCRPPGYACLSTLSPSSRFNFKRSCNFLRPLIVSFGGEREQIVELSDSFVSLTVFGIVRRIEYCRFTFN